MKQKKKVLAVLFLAFSVMFGTSGWMADVQAAETGAEEKSGRIFYISTEAELRNISADMTAAYVMTGDITLSGAWRTPSGIFTGSFDGNGYTIRGFRISSGTEGYAGLFGRLSGTVSNLAVENARINCGGDLSVGAIAGAVTGESLITNCNVTGTLNFNGSAVRAGALCGDPGFSLLTIDTCTSEMDISVLASGSSTIGALAGGDAAAKVVNSDVDCGAKVTQSERGPAVFDIYGLSAVYEEDKKNVRHSTVKGSYSVRTEDGEASITALAQAFECQTSAELTGETNLGTLSLHGGMNVARCQNTGNITIKGCDACTLYGVGLQGACSSTNSGDVTIEASGNSEVSANGIAYSGDFASNTGNITARGAGSTVCANGVWEAGDVCDNSGTVKAESTGTANADARGIYKCNYSDNSGNVTASRLAWGIQDCDYSTNKGIIRANNTEQGYEVAARGCGGGSMCTNEGAVTANGSGTALAYGLSGVNQGYNSGNITAHTNGQYHNAYSGAYGYSNGSGCTSSGLVTSRSEYFRSITDCGWAAIGNSTQLQASVASLYAVSVSNGESRALYQMYVGENFTGMVDYEIHDGDLQSYHYYTITADGNAAPVTMPEKPEDTKNDLNPRFTLSGGKEIAFTLPEDIPVLGNLELKWDLFSHLPVNYTLDRGKIYVAIGLGDASADKIRTFSDTARDIANTRKTLEGADNIKDILEKYYKEKGDALLKQKSWCGFRMDCQFMGFMQGYETDYGEIEWEAGGIVLSGQGETSWQWPAVIVVAGVPIPVFGAADLEGEAQMKAGLRETSKGSTDFTAFGDGNMEAAVRGGVGVGLRKLISAEGGVEGRIKVPFGINNPDDYIKVIGSLGGYWKVNIPGGFEAGKPFWTTEGTIYDSRNQAKTAARSLGVFSENELRTVTEEELMVSQTFLANQKTARSMDGDSGLYVRDSYGQSAPQLAAFEDGTMMAVWTGIDPAREARDRSCLYYSVCEDGRWSTPSAVEANGTGDYYPDLKIIGDTAYVTWCDFRSSVSEDASLTDTAALAEISAAVYHRESGKWEAKRLTDNHTLDALPVLCGRGEEVSVVWLTNSGNDWLGQNRKDGISSAHFNGSSWEVSGLYADRGCVVDLDAYYGAEGFTVAWTEDTDGDFATLEDLEIFADGVRITENGEIDSGVTFGEDGTRYWYHNGMLSVDGTDTGAELSTDHFQIVGNSVFYTKNCGLNSALLCISQEEASGEWSDPLHITDGSGYVESFSAVDIDGTMEVLANVTEVVGDFESADPYGQSNLVLRTSNEEAGHSYTYSDNADGTHTAHCVYCGASAAEEHTCENGSCIFCGREEEPDRSFTVGLLADVFVYDGNEKRPEVIVEAGGRVLAEGVDYTVVYDDNTEAGTATVNVTGMGAYAGTVARTFTIANAGEKPGTETDGSHTPPSVSGGGSGAGNPAAPPAAGTVLTETGTKNTYKVISRGKTVQYSRMADKKAAKALIPATVTIAGVTYKVTAVSSGAFSGCTKLKSVAIGKNVTSIGAKAFYKCTGLKKITIPAKVGKIGKQAFYGCKKLKNITVKTAKLTAKTVGAKAFKGTPAKAAVKVPKKKKKAYTKLLRAKGLAKTAKIK